MPSFASRPDRPSRARRRISLAVEPMERRELMAAKVRAVAPAVPRPPILIASMGDSLTDEYTFSGPADLYAQATPESLADYPANGTTLNQGTARNWVSALSSLRSGQLSFGQYSTANRGGTRLQGYSQDWARSGAAAVGGDLLTSGTTFVNQYLGVYNTNLPGMLTQTPNATGDVDPKSINVVTIYIGTNDYRTGAANYAQTNGATDPFVADTGMTNSVNAGIEDAVTSAIGKIRTTIPNVKIVVVTPQDLSATPLFTGVYGSVPGLFPKITSSLTQLNVDMARIAKKQKLGFVSLQAMAQQMGPTPTVAGQAIDLQAGGPDLNDAFVADGFHYGTVMQGKIAQAVVQQVNTLYGKNKTVVTPISDADILQFARATQTGVAATRAPSAADPAKTTLSAVVTAGAGNAAPPTGTVTFEAISPGTVTIPTKFGAVLGVAPVDATGRATLDVDTAALGTATYYAVYGGDGLHGARLSNALPPSGTA